MRSLKRFWDNAPDIIVNIYLSGMLGIYPFFMKTGYVGLSDAKYSFFLICSLFAIVLLFFTGFPRLITSITDKSFKDVHIAVLLFAVISILSFLFSRYKDATLLGAPEWYMGLVTILILCVMIYLISILWKPNLYIVYAALAVAAVVYVLGICDRFSFYLIPIKVRDPSFISTLGNINWFMGYYSIMTPLGMGMLLFDGPYSGSDRAQIIKRDFLYVYIAIAFICGFAQGAESVFLVFGAMFILLLLAVSKKMVSLQSLLIMMIMWCLSAQFVRIIRMLCPGAYNYNDSGICSFLTGNGITAAMAFLPAVLLLILSVTGNSRDNTGGKKSAEKIITIFLWLLLAAGVILYTVISLIKTNTDALPAITNSVFYWDRRFGSGRGEAFGVAFRAIGHMTFGQILIGVGPDGFESFVYSIEELRGDLYELFNGSRLVNSHCFLLTLFINEGLLGVAGYLAIPVTVLIRTAGKYKDTGRYRAFALSVSFAILCALAHGMISFSHILNVPFAAILIGMMLAFL
ncbi:MAG: hypothetical protein K5870_10720 [Lachnospiraceae bacterium]|nr:hypothetical protein [Lachnospiraceae bacterium]